jgi:hypothetical protein
MHLPITPVTAAAVLVLLMVLLAVSRFRSPQSNWNGDDNQMSDEWMNTTRWEHSKRKEMDE